MKVKERATWTLTEFAALVGCDPRTVSKATKDGSIVSFKIGRRVFIPKSAFEHLEPKLHDPPLPNRIPPMPTVRQIVPYPWTPQTFIVTPP